MTQRRARPFVSIRLFAILAGAGLVVGFALSQLAGSGQFADWVALALGFAAALATAAFVAMRGYRMDEFEATAQRLAWFRGATFGTAIGFLLAILAAAAGGGIAFGFGGIEAAEARGMAGGIILLIVIQFVVASVSYAAWIWSRSR